MYRDPPTPLRYKGTRPAYGFYSKYELPAGYLPLHSRFHLGGGGGCDQRGGPFWRGRLRYQPAPSDCSPKSAGIRRSNDDAPGTDGEPSFSEFYPTNRSELHRQQCY